MLQLQLFNLGILLIQNDSNGNIFISYENSVLDARGLKIQKHDIQLSYYFPYYCGW